MSSVLGGQPPPAALYYASRDRKHEHPVQHLQAFTGILQADAYDAEDWSQAR
jgi:transposase